MDQLFAQAEICRHCRTALRSAFEHTGTPVVYHRRQMIAWSGDSAQHVCLILDGCVKQYLLAPDGSAHTILLLGQGDIFNEVTFFHNDTSYAATQAVSDTTLVKIPTDVFRAILKAHPALYGDISQLLSYKLRITMAHIYDLSFESVEHRLQNLLRRLCAQMREPTADGVRIPYVFTHEDLAQMISAGRSNVSRCMNRFYSRDWVRFEGRCIVLRDGAFSAE